jgi:hypothetical protein
MDGFILVSDLPYQLYTSTVGVSSKHQDNGCGGAPVKTNVLHALGFLWVQLIIVKSLGHDSSVVEINYCLSKSWIRGRQSIQVSGAAALSRSDCRSSSVHGAG